MSSRCRRMCRIGALLEGPDADTAHGIDEALLVVAHAAVDLHDALEGGGHLVLGHRRTDHLAEGGAAAARRAPESDLVPLLAVLIHAQHADVADVVAPAGIHAAGHVQLD